jgi:hypothetical protein
MISIPDFLQQLIDKYLDILLVWFSQYIYDRLLQRLPEHDLVRLNTLLDFGPLEAACADYHKYNGMGRGIVHTVPRLLRVVLLRYYYNKSLRGTAALIHENMMAKWFAGYRLAHFGLTHTTIHDFETYLIEQHPRLFFDTVLDQILTIFPEQRTLPQIGDTFAILANAQREGLIDRLRHGAARLLLAIHGRDPAHFQQVTAALDLSALFGSAEEKATFLLTAAEKEARLTATVIQVDALLERVAALSAGRNACQVYIRFLHELLEKEIDLTRDEAGRVVSARRYQESERGSYRPISATDPDATIRNHGRDKVSDGYNATVVATTDFICEIEVATGSAPDAAGITPALMQMKRHHHLQPEKLIYDQAAGRGHTIAAVDKVTDGQTRLVVKPVQAGKKKEGDRFGPLDCTLTEGVDEETGEILPALVCPHGESTTTRYRSGAGQGYTYRMPAAVCADCPLAPACRGDAVQPHRHRQFFISDHRAPLLDALAYAETAAFKLDMKLRPQIERVIAGLVLHCGARYARFRGLVKVDYQAKMCAAVYNLKRWATLSDPTYRPPPRRTAAQVVLSLAAAA